jgi:adenylate cyclase, class 1
MTRHKQVLAPDFSEGVDRKLLKQIKERFLAINSARLSRAVQSMSARQRDILEVLPLLFHVNHALLPGYVSKQSPCGLAGYEPNKAALSIARSFSQTFRFRRDRRAEPAIHSIFMMGSTGTLAHSESSDVDLWLCHSPELTEQELVDLKSKADKLDHWANSHGLELHTFLMNAESFRRGKNVPEMDSESSGSAQHYLLLDEFYRTAILLGGRYPLWWLIPSQLEPEYEHYADLLLRQRFVKTGDVIDFGSVAHIPKSELAGAGLWQLYKSIDSPYKSVLKLLLAEVYAQKLPQQVCLSRVFKELVYQDEIDVEQLDPYLLIYRCLEAYLLESDNAKRLDLVRKSFYLKVNKKLSKKPGVRGASWQRKLVQKIVSEWGWRDRDFKRLDNRSTWKVDEVMAERQQLFSELNSSYRFLSDYARANNVGATISDEDVQLLGRKLNATFQRKAGKVEKVNPGIAPFIWEENLALHHTSSQPFQLDKNAWQVYRDLSAADDASFHASLKKSSNLIELLVWLFFNQIITTETRLSMQPGTSGLTLHELRSVIGAMSRVFELPLPSVSQLDFKNPAYVQKLLLFINIGVDPMSDLSEQGMLRLSDRTDSLGYSSKRNNLVKTIDQVALNSWNEMSARRYELGETLMQNLQAYLLMCVEQGDNRPCELHVFCFTSQRAEAIAKRVQVLFQDARNVFLTGQGLTAVRYIVEIEESFYIVQRVDAQFRYQAFATKEVLMASLSQGGSGYCQVALDRYALPEDALLRGALSRSTPASIQVFYQVLAEGFDVCVIDELGSVLCFKLAAENEVQFQTKLHIFLETILERRQLDQAILGQDQMPKIVWQKANKAKSELVFRSITVSPRQQFRPLTATAFYDGVELRFDLSFDDKDFSYAEYGDRQIEALVHYANHQGVNLKTDPLALKDVSYPSDPMLMRSNADQSRSSLDYLTLYHQIDSGIQALMQ